MIKKIFLTFFIVQLITFVTTIVGILVDGMVTGRFLGTDAMAAYGMVTPFLTLVTALATASSVGTSTLISSKLGRGEVEEMQKDFRICFWSILLFACAVGGTICVLAGPIATALKAEGEVHRMAEDYLRVYSLGFPAIFIVTLSIPTLQIIRRRLALISAIFVMLAVNVSMDFLNVLVWHKGMAGMALATTVSNFCALLITVSAIIYKGSTFSLKPIMPKVPVLKEMFVYGAPNAVSFGCRNILIILLNSLILNIAGIQMVAVYAAIMTSINITLSVGTGLASGVSMLTGVFSGEKDRHDLRKLVELSVRYSVIFGGITSAAYVVFSGGIVSLFLKEQGLHDAASTGLKIVALYSIFFSINFCIRSFYQAMKMKITLLYAVVNCLLSTLFFAYVLGHSIGIVGVWIAYPLGETMTFVLFGSYALWKERDKKSLSITERIMMIPDEYYSETEPIEISVASMKDAVAASQSTSQYMKEHGASDRIAVYAALAVEEMAGNIIQHGFKDGKHHHLDIKLKKDGDRWILRFRDDCRDFDPVAYVKSITPEQKESHYGIRMIYGLADEVKYLSMMKLNNLLICFRTSDNNCS